MGPVSYTHLDVYKRQSKNRILRRAKHDVVNISHMVSAILKLSRLEADVVAVSYTHLQ